MSTENTRLTARANLKEAEAAITEFDRVQAGLADLKTKFAGVVFPVVTTTGMKDAIAAEQRRQEDTKEAAARAEMEAEAQRLRTLEEEAERQRAEAEAAERAKLDSVATKARAIRVEIDALLDAMSNDELLGVLRHLQSVGQMRAAA